MKRIILLLGLAVAFMMASATASYSQSLIKKLKKKAEEKLIEKAFGEEEKTKQEDTGQETAYPSMENTRGSGLVTTPPDVKANIDDAGKAYQDKSFSKTRYAIRQALLGVEMEIGKNILEGLPEKIESLVYDKNRDQVTSTSIGFVGLTVERIYLSNDQEMTVTIGNDAAMLSAVNMYLSAGAYQQTSEEQDYKQVDFKGNRGILEYDDAEGYTLSVPFGQSSILIVNGINFTDEKEVMKAANHIDIERVKKELEEK